MTTVQLQELARVGAEARLRAISEERDALLRAFPDLGNGARPSHRASSTAPSTAPAARTRSGMSPAQRKAVGARMKAYWGKRRAEAGAKKAMAKPKRKGGMSAAARKAQGERMKAYWAAKRTQKVDGAREGTRAEIAGQNGAPSSKRAGKTGRKRKS